MRSLWLGVLVFAAMFVACGDDDSDFATRPSDDSSSSECEDCDGESSFSSSSKKSSGSVVGCKTETEDNCEYGELVDSRDGQTYKTVVIGSQTWMAENLNFKTDSSSCYIKEESNCAKYGRLYRWAAAVGKSESECGYGYTCSLPSGNIQGVCPNGWHLPSNDDWNTLFAIVGDSSVAGTMLKSTSGWFNWYKIGNGKDPFGFSALPAGSRNCYGHGEFEGYIAYFWSSTEGNGYGYDAYYMSLSYHDDKARLDGCRKNGGHSVRCIRD